VPISTTNKGVIHEKHLHPSFNQHLSRWSSLVNDADLTSIVNERENKESGPKGIRTPDPRHVKAVS
jgi:hypothetical protein